MALRLFTSLGQTMYKGSSLKDVEVGEDNRLTIKSKAIVHPGAWAMVEEVSDILVPEPGTPPPKTQA